MSRLVLTEQFYIPIKALDPELEALIPSDDTISYTSKIHAQEMGFRSPKKRGQLVLTNRGFAYKVAKESDKEEVSSLAAEIEKGYVPYSLIYEFHNKRKGVKLRYSLEDNPQDRRGWVFKVECCTEYGESMDGFRQRQSLFGAFFEHLYRQATGLGLARVGLHLHVPVEDLTEELRSVFPPDDTIFYTSLAKIVKTGIEGHKRQGYVVLTDSGLALRGGTLSRGSLIPTWPDFMRGHTRDYIPYELIHVFKNKRSTVRIVHTPRDKPGAERGWLLKVMQSNNESKADWARRKHEFGDIFAQLLQARREKMVKIIRFAKEKPIKFLYIPISLLVWEVKALVPPKEAILYTSKALIKRKRSIGASQEFGVLALTDNRFVFRAPEAAISGAHEGSVRYDLVTEFENKGEVVRLRHVLEDPKDSEEWEFKVVRCVEFWESKESFNRRKGKFGDFFEEQYRLGTSS